MIRLHWVPPAPEESRQDYGRRLREEAHWLRDAVLKEMGFDYESLKEKVLERLK